MAVTFRTNTSTNSATGTEPTGAASGDVLIAIAEGSSAPTLPTGWTSELAFTDSTTFRSFLVAAMIRGSSAPSYAFTHATNVTVYCAEGSSFAETPSLANIAVWNTLGPSSGTANFPAITSQASTDGVIIYFRGGSSTYTGSAPTGFTVGTQASTAPWNAYGNQSGTGNGGWSITISTQTYDTISIDVGDPSATTVTKTATFDAVAATVVTKTATFDAVLAQRQTKAATFDAVAATRVTKTATFDANMATPTLKTATFDADTAVQPRTATFDSVAANVVTHAATFDADTATRVTKTVTFDAVAAPVTTKSATFDAVSATRVTKTATFDAAAANRVTHAATFDGVAAAHQTINATFDAVAASVALKTATFDAVAAPPHTTSATFDAILVGQQVKTATFDAVFGYPKLLPAGTATVINTPEMATATVTRELPGTAVAPRQPSAGSAVLQ